MHPPDPIEPNAEPRRRRTRASRAVLAWVERSLYLFGAVCLGWVAWVQIDSTLFQRRALAALESGAAGVEGSRETAAIASGAPLARLRLPRLDLAVMVAEGTGEEVLRRAVGHLAGSDLPGDSGHVVLAGHRDTFFRPLEAAEVGDIVEIDTGVESLAYRVSWIRVVEPTDVWVLEDPGYPALTLVTCYPFRYVGDAPQRFIVRAHRVDSAALAAYR
jgi:sortase A